MEKALSVFLDGNFAGTLACTRDGLSFRYSRRWLNHRRFVPLSVTLPRTDRRYGHKVAYPYFENLLPESKLRTALATTRGVAADDIFELLEKVGGDCAGAVSLALPGTVPARDPKYALLGPREIKALIAHCGGSPLFAVDPCRRMTLAGSAQKTSVCLRLGRLYNGSGNAPTTHILKPESEKLPHSAANEAFCISLAARAGLPVASSVLLQRGNRLFVIARSDRVERQGRIKRLHEIDFCQAGNFTSLKKYEKEGGAGLARLFELGAQYVSDWPRARNKLITWVIFNYLIGNRDTHAKNLSLTIGADRIRLTPFYDLLSTAIYPHGEKELSLKIGGQNRAHAVTRAHWRQFARDIRVEWPIVEAVARELSGTLPRQAEAVAAGMKITTAERQCVRAITQLIAAQCRHIQQVLA